MKPWYEDEACVIYNGDAFELLPQLAAGGIVADMVLTDPPYCRETHDGARTGKEDRKLIDFDAMPPERLREAFALLAPMCRSWLVSFVDYHQIPVLESSPSAGLRFVRFGVWVKHDAAPQFTGDRPGMGWEAVAVMHATGGQMQWNGGGHHGVWHGGVQRKNKHPTEKPERLVREMIRQFSSPGDLILDPFMGGGTTLYAAKGLGRRAIGIEKDVKWCRVAREKLKQAVLPLWSAKNDRGDRDVGGVRAARG